MGDLQLYYGDAVNIGLVLAIATALTQMLKPYFDKWLSPTSDVHDATIRLCTLALSLVGVIALQATSPAGLHSNQQWAGVIVQTLAAVLGSFGLYRLVNGSVPATPTDTHLTKMAIAHGDALAARLSSPPSPPTGGVAA